MYRPGILVDVAAKVMVAKEDCDVVEVFGTKIEELEDLVSEDLVEVVESSIEEVVLVVG